MQKWDVYYYKKAKFYYLLILPFLVAVFAPMVFATLKQSQFKKFESWFEMALIVGMIIFMIGFFAIYRIATRKHKASLILQNGVLWFIKKEIIIAEAHLEYGRYGSPAAGSFGTTVYISNKSKKISIGVLNHTLSNINDYKHPWSMKVDCFLEKNELQSLLDSLAIKTKTSAASISNFAAHETVFELRKPMSIGATLGLYYAFIAVSITFILLFSISNPIVITLMILTAFGSFIYFKINQDSIGKGFFLVFRSGNVKILHLNTRREILSLPQSSVFYKVYLKTNYGRNGSYTWLTLQLNLTKFKKITIGQAGPLGRNIWKNSGLPEMKFTFSDPQFKVDQPTWNKIASLLGVVPPLV